MCYCLYLAQKGLARTGQQVTATGQCLVHTVIGLGAKSKLLTCNEPLSECEQQYLQDAWNTTTKHGQVSISSGSLQRSALHISQTVLLAYTCRLIGGDGDVNWGGSPEDAVLEGVLLHLLIVQQHNQVASGPVLANLQHQLVSGQFNTDSSAGCAHPLGRALHMACQFTTRLRDVQQHYHRQCMPTFRL